jgi:hypothetical protein
MLMGSTLLLAACSSTQPIVTEAVGPRPLGLHATPPSGVLTVHSATERHSSGDIHYFPHSDYEVFSTDGRLIQKVRNALSSYDEDPVTVRLPTGRYTVVADDEYAGPVEVPVVIRTGRLTEVHLDGDWKPPAVAVADDKLVRFPSGRVIGWRAIMQ